MITENLRINQLSPSAYTAYLDYLAALDARDIDAFARFLAEDVVIRFGNADPVVGKAAVTGMLASYWQAFAGLEHDLANIYGEDDHFVLEADNHYTRHDGKMVTVRAVAFTDRNAAGEVTSIRIYGDTSPVFAAAD